MNKVILLCGKVGSGKTYYANKLHKSENAVILSCDELMLTLFDECLGNRHDEIHSRCFEFLAQTAIGVVETQRDAILDFGFWTEDSRKSAKDFFERRNIPCEIHYIKSNDSARKQRVEKRNKELTNSTRRREYIITTEMLERFDKCFEEPKKADKTIDN